MLSSWIYPGKEYGGNWGGSNKIPVFKKPGYSALYCLVFGGGGGNRTRVRKHSAFGSTCLSRSIYLIASYPTGREDAQRAWLSFNGSTPGALHRDPIWGDSRYPVVWARSRAEGNLQVFKLRVRSCRRWQLKVCNQFNELSAARHAPRVSLPASKPGRPP